MQERPKKKKKQQQQQQEKRERGKKKKRREEAESVQGRKRQKIKEKERRITECKRGKKEKSCRMEKERKNIMFSCHFSGSHNFLIIYNNVIEHRCLILENWYEELSKFDV